MLGPSGLIAILDSLSLSHDLTSLNLTGCMSVVLAFKRENGFTLYFVGFAENFGDWSILAALGEFMETHQALTTLLITRNNLPDRFRPDLAYKVMGHMALKNITSVIALRVQLLMCLCSLSCSGLAYLLITETNSANSTSLA